MTEPAPVGPVVEAPPSGRRPVYAAMIGTSVALEPLAPERHAPGLYEAAQPERIWTYLPHGPFATSADFDAWLRGFCINPEPMFFVVVDRADGRPRGMASYLNIVPAMGTIEVGYIWYTPGVQRTRLPTETMYLMFRHVFDELGYRRLEWKCNALNGASRRAAERLGFTYEGIFRQHMVVKGRNRDSAWYSLLDGEWPAVRAGFERWLAPDNFDADGNQRASLRACR